MQFTIVTLTTLFAAALAAPSEVSARQAPLAMLTTFRDSGCSNSFGPTIPLYITPAPACRNLPVGIAGGKIFDTPRANCQIVFHVGPGCSSQQTYTWPRDNTVSPTQCFTLGGADKPIGSYQTIGTCA